MTTKITYFRNKIGLTQEQLAEIVGVARQTIIALEQGRYNPSLALAAAITRALRQKHVEEVFKL